MADITEIPEGVARPRAARPSTPSSIPTSARRSAPRSRPSSRPRAATRSSSGGCRPTRPGGLEPRGRPAGAGRRRQAAAADRRGPGRHRPPRRRRPAREPAHRAGPPHQEHPGRRAVGGRPVGAQGLVAGRLPQGLQRPAEIDEFGPRPAQRGPLARRHPGPDRRRRAGRPGPQPDPLGRARAVPDPARGGGPVADPARTGRQRREVRVAVGRERPGRGGLARGARRRLQSRMAGDRRPDDRAAGQARLRHDPDRGRGRPRAGRAGDGRIQAQRRHGDDPRRRRRPGRRARTRTGRPPPTPASSRPWAAATTASRPATSRA
jgi:hypothetical protein